MIQNCLVNSAAVVRDVTQIADYVIATTPFRLDTGFPMEFSDDSGRFICVNSFSVDKEYTNIFYSEEQIAVMHSTYDSLYYRGDVNGLLRYMGIRSAIRYQTINTDWLISRGSIRSLITTLNNYASVNSGGCPFFSLDLKGQVRCVDLKYEYDNVSKEDIRYSLPYRLQSDLTLTDWMIQTPSVTSVIDQTLDGKTSISDIENSDLGIHTSLVVNDNTGFTTNNIKTRIKNEYNRRYYRSRVVTFSDTADICKLGDVVNIGDQILVVDKIHMPIALADGSIKPISVQAVAPYINR